jgi:hypothetical protein
MKKLYAIAVIFVFAGITAFGLHFFNVEDGSQRKASCATVAEAAGCGHDNAVLTSGAEKSSCGSASVKSATAAAAGCGQTENAVLTSGAEKSSCDDSTKTATAEASCCSSAATQTANAGECSEQTEATRIAENQ